MFLWGVIFFYFRFFFVFIFISLSDIFFYFSYFVFWVFLESGAQYLTSVLGDDQPLSLERLLCSYSPSSPPGT